MIFGRIRGIMTLHARNSAGIARTLAFEVNLANYFTVLFES